MGLREQKKQQTRDAIADAAWRLFADRGFPAVTVAEIARAAGVSTATVFNYFPTKEDLVFPRLEAFGERLVEAVAARPAGTSAPAAVRDFVLQPGGLLAAIEHGDRGATERLRTISRMVADSPSLQDREQRAIIGYTDALAGRLAAEAGAPVGDVGAWITANALIGVHRALIELARSRVLADDRVAEIGADVRAEGSRAFALLERGLAR